MLPTASSCGLHLSPAAQRQGTVDACNLSHQLLERPLPPSPPVSHPCMLHCLPCRTYCLGSMAAGNSGPREMQLVKWWAVMLSWNRMCCQKVGSGREGGERYSSHTRTSSVALEGLSAPGATDAHESSHGPRYVAAPCTVQLAHRWRIQVERVHLVL
jgi:hypothetical protein